MEARFHLLNPLPILISPLLARKIGLDESILLLTLERLCADNGAEREGRNWYGISNTSGQRLFPWLTPTRLKTALDKLVEADLLIEVDFRVNKTDTTRYFSIQYEASKHLKGLTVLYVDEQSDRKKVDTPLLPALEALPPPQTKPVESYEERYRTALTDAIHEACGIDPAMILTARRGQHYRQLAEAITLFRKLYPGLPPERIASAITIFGHWWTSRPTNNGGFLSSPSIATLTGKWNDFMKYIKDHCDNRMPSKEYFEEQKKGR